MWTGAFSLGQLLSPLVVTVLSKQFGGVLPAFTTLALAALLGVLIAFAGKFQRGDHVEDGAVPAHG